MKIDTINSFVSYKNHLNASDVRFMAPHGFHLPKPFDSLPPHPRAGSAILKKLQSLANKIKTKLKTDRDLQKISNYKNELIFEGSTTRINT